MSLKKKSIVQTNTIHSFRPFLPQWWWQCRFYSSRFPRAVEVECTLPRLPGIQPRPSIQPPWKVNRWIVDSWSRYVTINVWWTYVYGFVVTDNNVEQSRRSKDCKKKKKKERKGIKTLQLHCNLFFFSRAW